MEEETQLWKEESCGDRVRHDESEVHRESELQRIQRAAARVVDQSDPSQLGTSELLGVCQEVTFHTEPLSRICW